MVAFILGIVCILVSVFLVLPYDWALGWWNEVLFVLKGGLPIFLIAVGMFLVLVGLADFYDAYMVKKHAATTDTPENEGTSEKEPVKK